MLKIINKIEFENNLFVASIDSSFANSSEENRIEFVTDIASISRGKLGFEGIDRQRLYKSLLIESNNNPSTPFEFVPVKINSDFVSYEKNNTELYKYSNRITFADNKSFELTNLRAIIKANIKYETIPYNTKEEVENFKVIIAKIPKVAFDHLVTHREITRIAESSRNKKYLDTVEFWYPSKWDDATKEYFIKSDILKLNEMKNIVYNKNLLKPEEATKELSCRRLMLCAFCAWKQNKNSWDNLFAIRGKGTKAQNITQQVVENIKKLIN